MPGMTTPERPIPPMNVDERTALESWLEFQRTTLAMKCEGLDDVQLREASAPPSPITLLGLVRHMAEVERNWFRRVLVQEDVGMVYDGAGEDGSFGLLEGITVQEAFANWRQEIDRGRANCVARSLDDTGILTGKEVNLRWIYLHMIEEYARHNGHADLIRERIDGQTGE
jgi:Protein of unknown function (DUF664)